MASLTYTAWVSRRMIKFGGVGLVTLMFLWWGISTGIRAYKKAHPPKLPPTMKYGLLPKVVFPKKEYEKKKFTAELANDAFPKFDDQAKVFVIYRPDKDILALEHDKKTAESLGFLTEPTPIRAGVYEFRNDNLSQTLTINVLDGSFVLKYPYLQDQTLLDGSKIPSENEAISQASTYLSNANRLTADLADGDKKVTYWKIEYDGLKAAASRSEANVAKVDFYRAKIDDEYAVVGSQKGAAPVSVLVSGADMASKKIIEVNYKSMEVDRESYSTYPIKTVEQAWEDLKMGNYWPAMDSSGDQVVISNIYLAYFEPVALTNFLQPVFVFEGKNDFVAYVTAVEDSKIKK